MMTLPTRPAARSPRNRIVEFLRHEGAAFAPIFALVVLSLGLASAFALEYTHFHRARTDLQDAVDSAALSIAQTAYGTTGTPTGSQYQAAATTVVQAEAPGATVTEIHTCGSTGSDCSTSTAGTLVAGQVFVKASASREVLFASLLPTMARTITASAVAQTGVSPTEATLTMRGAKGWYWKKVELYKHVAGASSDTLLGTWVYQPKNLNNSEGTSELTAYQLTPYVAPGVGGPGTFSGPTAAIALGSNYDKIYLKLTVSKGFCGPDTKYASYSTIANVVCQSAPGYQPYPLVVFTTNGTGADHLVELKNTTSADMGRVYRSTAAQLAAPLIECGKTLRYGWEDVDGPPPSTNAATWTSPTNSWVTQDLFFDITGAKCQLNANFKSYQGSILIR